MEGSSSPSDWSLDVDQGFALEIEFDRRWTTKSDRQRKKAPAEKRKRRKTDNDRRRGSSRNHKADREWKVATIREEIGHRAPRANFRPKKYYRQWDGDLSPYLLTRGYTLCHEIVCKYFPACTRKSQCKFLHLKSKDIDGPSFNCYATTTGLLYGQTEDCWFHALGTCKRGANCPFLHRCDERADDNPTSAEDLYPKHEPRMKVATASACSAAVIAQPNRFGALDRNKMLPSSLLSEGAEKGQTARRGLRKSKKAETLTLINVPRNADDHWLLSFTGVIRVSIERDECGFGRGTATVAVRLRDLAQATAMLLGAGMNLV